jgi:hypothetical protein
MKKLKFILLILVSIFCLNSCLTTAFVIGSMQGDGLLPPPEYKSPYYFGNNKKLNTLLLTENKKKIEIGNSNVQISIPSGLKLKESNGFINNYLYEKKSFELHGYYLEKEIFLPIFIFNESFEEFLKTENLVKLNENTYLNFEKNSKNRKLDQIIKKIDDNVFAVVSIVDMNDKSKNFFLELMKDW